MTPPDGELARRLVGVLKGWEAGEIKGKLAKGLKRRSQEKVVGKTCKRAEGRKPRKSGRSQEKLKAGDLEPLPLPLQSTLYTTDTFGTGTKCPSYRKSNRGSKERQGPTLGVRFTEVSVKRESTVYCEWSSFFPQSQTRQAKK